MRTNKSREGKRGSLSLVITVSEVAQLLGVHVNTVRNWSNRGLIPTFRVGPRGDRRFRRNDVIAFFSGSRKAS